MKRNYPQRISQVIDTIFKDNDMEQTMLMHRALAAWPQVVGPMINRQTVYRSVDKDTLYVRIPSSVIRQELSMHRNELIKALNKAVGADVLSNIKIL